MEIADSIAAVLGHKGSDVWSIAPDATVFEAIEKMAEKNVGALAVLDGEQLAGIVSERDYTRKVILQGKSSRETSVHEIMTTDLVTITESESVVDSLELMTEKRVRHLPVMDGDKLAGIVTIGDLVKWVISAQRALIDQLEGYIRGGYPG